MERPPTDLGWYVKRLRQLMLALNAPAFQDVLLGEHVEYGEHGLPRSLGELTSVENYRPRFAELLSRGWGWINLHGVGLVGTSLVVSVELPPSPQQTSIATSVNISGPTRAVVERHFDLRSVLEEGDGAG